mmetsp:Transcript_29257/g.65500  ORF Transcript_29257/g.65500 Transcript_29257/m.65500 type:complete len:389 (+) Transcript_29257:84-1250(+)|eukprot:CAMPEP_0172593878 /NCGR_PEP_ID=MMETSP1068-20121228/13127_1 /TAXON_ID=35684 /ORGANISM="Pseudopedinella elastica, Strain CCMP716" /LENGTH=388 /DNA_ID=CAMNT_0013391581 /DNA_START=644 /DNA_END=1810 /DNA_ORIENTATION=-
MSAAGPSAPSTLQVSVGAPAVCSFSRAPGDSGTRGSDLFNIGATDEHAPLTWYPVRAVEKGQPAGQPATHRRFRDFTDLDEAIKAAFSGHHLRSSLPKLPPKSSKLFYDHSDPKFQEQRRAGLDQWLNKLVNIPRVLEVPSVLPFLGIAAALREVSFIFEAASIGLTIQRAGGPASKLGASGALGGGDGSTSPGRFPSFPAVVEQVKGGPGKGGGGVGGGGGGLRPGDIITKVNGYSTASMGFREVVDYISSAPRPLVCHFLQLATPRSGKLGGPPPSDFPPRGEAAGEGCSNPLPQPPGHERAAEERGNRANPTTGLPSGKEGDRAATKDGAEPLSAGLETGEGASQSRVESEAPKEPNNSERSESAPEEGGGNNDDESPYTGELAL